MTTLLYVEDHPPAQLLMQAIIHDLTPYHLVLASTGEEALVQAAAHQPDLYILDLDLPDTDGVALARSLYALRPAPVIIVSAYAEATQVEHFSQVTAYYLGKPLDPDHVAQTIQHALAGQQ
jgi:two-component system, OmpR family, KDP operon response regulator KdpE